MKKIISPQELCNRYDNEINTVLVTGDITKDSLTIEKLINSNVKPQKVVLIFFSFNKNEEYNNYVNELYNKYNLLDYEIFYIEEIITLYQELENINILVESDIIFKFSNLFLTIASLAIARTEAIGSENLWLPFCQNSLEIITPNVEEYINHLKNMANIGTLAGNRVDLHFPILNFNNRNNVAIKNKSYNKLNEDKSLVLFSSGIDSTAAAHVMQKMKKDLHLLYIQYGHSNRFQEEYCISHTVNDLSEKGNVDFLELSVKSIKQIGGSACLNDDFEIVKDNSQLEYIPFRNTILINLSIIEALKKGIKYIVTGSHHDDTLSPDNRLVYFDAFQKLLELQYSTQDLVLYPVALYIGGKCELIYILNEIGAELKYCWSCLNFIDKSESGVDAQACGTCGNCSTRYSAFERLGLKDSIKYKSIPHIRKEWSGWVEGSDEILEKIGVKKKTF